MIRCRVPFAAVAASGRRQSPRPAGPGTRATANAGLDRKHVAGLAIRQNQADGPLLVWGYTQRRARALVSAHSGVSRPGRSDTRRGRQAGRTRVLFVDQAAARSRAHQSARFVARRNCGLEVRHYSFLLRQGPAANRPLPLGRDVVCRRSAGLRRRFQRFAAPSSPRC